MSFPHDRPLDTVGNLIDTERILLSLGERHGVLEGLLRLVERDWQQFRGRPETASLERLGRSVAALDDHLRACRLLIKAAGTAGEQAAFPEIQGPSGRSSPTAGVESRGEGELPEDRGDGPETSSISTAGVGSRAGSARYPPFRDQETGLHSREGFDAVASGELKRCRRYERAFALLLIQLAVRDPDELRRAAGVVRRSLRESDLAGRHVDRTLAVALPETGLDDGRRVAGRLVSGLERVGVWGEEARLGIAGHPIDGETLLALFDTARGQLSLAANVVLDPTGREPAERG
jgi:GGDEF domain-containing protein